MPSSKSDTSSDSSSLSSSNSSSLSSSDSSSLSSSTFTLYNYFRSSASHRARLALHVKKIDFNYHAIHLLNNGGEQNSKEYSDLNPLHQVPTLVHRVNGEERVIGQSVAIVDYLDAVQPATRLFPEEAHARAICLQVCEIINSGMQPLFNLKVLNQLGVQLGAEQEKRNAWTQYWIRDGLAALETFLKNRAGEFSLGTTVTAADCFLIPQLVTADRFHVSSNAYPTLSRIRENCESLPAFRAASPFAQIDTPPELRAQI